MRSPDAPPKSARSVGAQSVGAAGLQLDLGQTILNLDASIRVLALSHPAAAIRDAIESGDDAALAAIDPSSGRYLHVLWRRGEGAAIRTIGAAAFAFLSAVLQGQPAEAALEAALLQGDELSLLQTEIFAAPFARLTLNSSLESDR